MEIALARLDLQCFLAKNHNAKFHIIRHTNCPMGRKPQNRHQSLFNVGVRAGNNTDNIL